MTQQDTTDDSINEFLNKKVKIFLKNNFCYTATILQITPQTLEIVDRFNFRLSINRDNVSVIQSLDQNNHKGD